MSTTQVSAPVALAVSLEDIGNTLRLGADELAEITRSLTLTVNAITAEAEHVIQRSLVNRAMRVTLDSFPDGGAIRLDRGPVVTVDTVKYRDAAGVLQTLDPQDWELDSASVPGWIVPAAGKAWPATSDRVNSVTVDYTAGYGADSSAVPPCAQQYILLRLADLWDPAVREFKQTPASEYAGSLLHSLIVY